MEAVRVQIICNKFYSILITSHLLAYTQTQDLNIISKYLYLECMVNVECAETMKQQFGIVMAMKQHLVLPWK